MALVTHTDDECCGALLSEALRSGALDAVSAWACPKCGLGWRAEIYRLDAGEIEGKHWAPYSPVLMFQP